MAGPTRGLSVRRAGPAAGGGGSAPLPGRATPVATPAAGAPASRLTDFYDDYIDAYSGNDAPLPPLPAQQQLESPNRVANWARNNASPANGPGSVRSRPPPSSYAPSTVGGTLRRKTTRRSNRAPRSTYYEEEEEGYVSGDYDDGPFEMTKIRVKVRSFRSFR